MCEQILFKIPAVQCQDIFLAVLSEPTDLHYMRYFVIVQTQKILSDLFSLYMRISHTDESSQFGFSSLFAKIWDILF